MANYDNTRTHKGQKEREEHWGGGGGLVIEIGIEPRGRGTVVEAAKLLK